MIDFLPLSCYFSCSSFSFQFDRFYHTSHFSSLIHFIEMKWSSLNTIFLRRDRFNNSSSVFPCSLFSFKQKHKTLKWKRSKISNFQQQQQTLNKNKNNAKATPVFPLLLTLFKCVFLVQILNSLETDKTLNEFRFKIRI